MEIKEYHYQDEFQVQWAVEGVTHVVYVGDPHLDSTTPSSRIDDYPRTMLEKFSNMVLQFNTQFGKDFIIVLLGDVFHKNTQAMLYLSQVVKVMRECSERCSGIFSIAGNAHDLAYDRLDSIGKAPLRLLFESGYVMPIGNVSVQSPSKKVLSVVGFWYPEKCLNRKEASFSRGFGDLGRGHMVGHRFFNTSDPTSLTMGFVQASGYDAVILGHDHIQYPIEMYGSTKVVRPGSFSRGTAHQSNLGRVVDVAVYSIEDESWKYVPVKCKDPKYVFSSMVLHKDSPKKISIQVLNQRIKDLIGNLDVDKGKSRIYEVMDRITMEDPVRKMIEVYLVNEGIYRDTK